MRWSSDYDLYVKSALFCGTLREEMETETQSVKPRYRARKNLVATLPDRFTLNELIALSAKTHSKTKPSNMINLWIHRGLISEIGEGRFQKTERYRKIYKC